MSRWTSGSWVDVKHPNRGDLTLDLVAPDGTASLLEDVPGGDSGGLIDAWSLRFGPG
ncbi:proprotein convertase P-domain-containing protein [Saccharothrix saharensis]|uniref:proprotein convertase P-domain-containing protein n=1 Tax=Saccharothrix saharensis TaxID=571190 RepID=UPI0011540AC5|nr:proprotein convertase P-domain-containing protein [Saccharothrix saharensis]